MASDGDAFAIRRRRGQAPLEFYGNNNDAGLELSREALAHYKFSLQSGRQAISFGEARGKMSVIFPVPTPEFVAIVTGECVAAAIAIVVIVSMFTLVIPPMSVAVVPSTIFVVLVFVSKGCVSGKHKKAENDDRKAFSSIQRFPPT
jgi:hypothetical protein